MISDWDTQRQTEAPQRPYDDRRRPEGRRGRNYTAIIAVVLGVILVGSLTFVAAAKQSPTSIKPKAVRLLPTSTAPNSWKLALDSSFAGDTVDSKVWDTCYPWIQSGLGCTNFGNTADGDPEDEWYMPSQDQVSGGILHLVAQRESTPGTSANGAAKEYECRSGMVTSYPGFQFEYGYVQITAKIPYGAGLWSAFWLAAANKKWPPEVDVLEHWHNYAQGKVYLHPLTGPRQGGAVSTPNLRTGWHTFTLEWTKTRLTWYYDGHQVFSTTTGVPHQEMYLVMNLADDANTPGSCSGSLDIKSVKVWQPTA